ncbi:MAG: YkgJ family cysteine cluster protein [Planctomycetota bacterium]|jgi:Fe-S-cluster containining protein
MTGESNAPPPEDPRQPLQERIVADSPRLGPEDTFRFACHPGLSCFNRCCSDVNIFLSPYDVLRMKKRLGMTSTDFLEKYTLLPVHKEMKTPVVLLRMNEDEAKTCTFLTEKGCSIYSDRPWPCRMYPLGLAAQKDTPDGWRGERFYFLLEEEGCQGYGEKKEWTVRGWLEDQSIDEYDLWGEQFKELTLHEYFAKGGVLSPEKMHMLFLACYDLDKFREFVFRSTLLQRFEIDEDFLEGMRTDDEELLRFGFHWLRFSLFGEKTVKVKPAVAEAFRGNLDKKDLFSKEPGPRT